MWCHVKCSVYMMSVLYHPPVLEPVYVNVYRLKDSDLGFYHTGVGREADQ